MPSPGLLFGAMGAEPEIPTVTRATISGVDGSVVPSLVWSPGVQSQTSTSPSEPSLKNFQRREIDVSKSREDLYSDFIGLPCLKIVGLFGLGTA